MTNEQKIISLLHRLTYPEDYPEEKYENWHSGDGPFEALANEIANKSKELITRFPKPEVYPISED